ncbi:hypothetical protein N473_17725 [Pseudoalteromonas luteoviolacea CPMOR-1]|uniref:Uncharacterized protein n=1 Tax=Pseudoalteromonas luteoviolacea CPMOR-1 TaxID=1365248 RepID=A0A167KU20_9GAMM|nr:hypothetical protein N473_17725 [Pseudoalteromonas luteoviolacea CPMOR-1]
MVVSLKKKSFKNLSSKVVLSSENTKNIGGGSCDMTCDCFANAQLVNNNK